MLAVICAAWFRKDKATTAVSHHQLAIIGQQIRPFPFPLTALQQTIHIHAGDLRGEARFFIGAAGRRMTGIAARAHGGDQHPASGG